MKKYFFIAMAAVLGLAVASCKPEPEVSPLKIEVSDITGEGATITVTCSTTDYFWRDIALPEDLAAYANPYEYWVNEAMITEEYYNEYADAFAQYLDIHSYDEVKAMYLLTTEETAECELEPETEYVVYAFRLNEDLTLKSTLIDTVHFTTLEGPSEEEIYYQLEPTTPVTLDMTATQSAAVVCGNFYNETSSNFAVMFANAANQMLVLDISAANGSTTLPAGTYTVANPTDITAIGAGQMLAGNAMLYSQYNAGTYAVLSDTEALWIVNGTLNVQVADGVYTITGKLTSYYGSTVNVSYTGAIEFQQPQQAAKRVAKPIFSLDVKGHVFNRK